MPKALRYLLIGVASILALLILAVAGLVFMIDPNAYKPQIEKLAEEKTRLDLNLAGDIDWSLLPLGLELNTIDATLDGAPFLKLGRLVARVDLFSLLKMQPSVHTFELIGLDLNLVVDENGEGNWQRILPESDARPQDKPQEQDQPSKDGELAFNVNKVNIAETRLHYRDKASGQELTLDELSLQSSDIALGQSFPLELQFHIAVAEPELDLRTKLSARLTANEALDKLLLEDLDSRFEIAGAPLNGEQITATAKGTVNADLKNEQIDVQQLAVTAANLSLTSDLVVTQYSSDLSVKGTLSVAEFSPRELLKKVGQAVPETSDPSVLRKLSLRAELGGKPGYIELKPLTVQLDDSQLNGTAGYTLENGAIFTRLDLDKIDLDRYLPPSEPESADEEKPVAQTQAPETDLLPLETLRGLRWDAGVNIGQLTASEIVITQVKLLSTANDGLIKVKPLSGQLYEGSFEANASINAESDQPRWQLQTTVSDVKTLPLLTQLADMQQFSGLANINANLATSGNRVSVLRNNAKGQADFAIKQGRLEGTNMAALACEGIALTHKESIDTSTWPKETPFQDLSGALSINGNNLNNTALTAQMKGMRLEGQGQINAETLALDYKAGLRILGNIHENPSCRVNERLTDVIIPVKCEGSLAGEKGLPCKFDAARFRDTLAGMAKAEAKQKASEEIDRGKEKLREKAQEKFKKLFQ